MTNCNWLLHAEQAARCLELDTSRSLSTQDYYLLLTTDCTDAVILWFICSSGFLNYNLGQQPGLATCGFGVSNNRGQQPAASGLATTGVSNLRRRGRMRLISASEVAFSGFDKTWNLNLHLIIIAIRLSWVQIRWCPYEVVWKLKRYHVLWLLTGHICWKMKLNRSFVKKSCRPLN